MPIYEYRCDACGHELERIQRMNEAPLKKCPACGKSKLHRLVSAPGFRLKGGGWYETDFKKDGKRNLHDSQAADKPADKDSKPAEVKSSEAKSSETKTPAGESAKPSAG